ncbi:YkgJ family cysteine cluster protein [Serratia fonticola]|uniref:YkgJ family cysteine cluster protein n=1 Tax=Serratia fonticola TaxID=47917 RepID=UPI0024DEC8DC|nr:YkgJ family cysteine cluster protein [Serratia fonticola]MDK2375054.1 YkgJ family cysteine cluster protein [Serratia fonticola]
MDVKEVKKLTKKAQKNTADLFKLRRYLLDPIEQEVINSSLIACKKGCSHCCYLRVDAYDFEVISIYNFIQERINKEVRNIIEIAVKNAYLTIKNISEHEHHITNVKCPFLLDDSCSIYPVRPMSCAGYSSLSEEICKHSYDHPDCLSGDIPRDPNIFEATMNAHSYVRAALNKEDEPMLELISSIYKMIESPSVIINWKQNRKMHL